MMRRRASGKVHKDLALPKEFLGDRDTDSASPLREHIVNGLGRHSCPEI
jgi:hypothetical protein